MCVPNIVNRTAGHVIDRPQGSCGVCDLLEVLQGGAKVISRVSHIPTTFKRSM